MRNSKSTGNSLNTLTVYLVLANGITWLCWLPGLLIGGPKGYTMPNFNTYAELFETGFANTEHMLLGIWFALGTFGPLIAGIIATRMDAGREGLTALWRQITHWRVSGRWYLYAILIAISLTAVPVLVFGLVGGFAVSALTIPFVLFILLAQVFTSGLGEEPGWRGFLLPKLREKYAGDRYVWMLGLFWAIWHYPLYFLAGISGAPADLPQLQVIIGGIVSLAGPPMSIIGLTFIYVWLMNKTGSVFLAIVFHAMTNTFNYYLMTFLESPQAATLAAALMPWLVVVIFQRLKGKGWFSSNIMGQTISAQ